VPKAPLPLPIETFDIDGAEIVGELSVTLERELMRLVCEI
jgi:hypothetical protein